jgi:proteic killer suppression protein
LPLHQALNMEIEFKADYLRELYEEMKSDDKRFKSNPQLIKQYIKTVKKLRDISRIEELYQHKSLKYEKKIGDLKGKSAVYINMQYRLIFEEIPDDKPPNEIKILALEEISKHYE